MIARRLKRIQSSAHLRQLFLAGVFLIVPFLYSPSASALEPAFQDKTANSDIKNIFKTKQELIRERSGRLQKTQKEANQVAATKQDLSTQVDSIKSEVQVLQAKLDEKKRLEALRIVVVGSYAPDASGNLYDPGQCTWYAKSRRPDLPNNLGNASSWYDSAAAQGFKVGSMAKTNAIGVQFGGLGHVVYVDKWLGNGQILISEMNYAGPYSERTRVASETDFVYIYEKS